jgi:hypothetical protein
MDRRLSSTVLPVQSASAWTCPSAPEHRRSTQPSTMDTKRLRSQSEHQVRAVINCAPPGTRTRTRGLRVRRPGGRHAARGFSQSAPVTHRSAWLPFPSPALVSHRPTISCCVWRWPHIWVATAAKPESAAERQARAIPLSDLLMGPAEYPLPPMRSLRTVTRFVRGPGRRSIGLLVP